MTIKEGSIVKVKHAETTIARVIAVSYEGIAEIELVGTASYVSQMHPVNTLTPYIEDEQDFTEVANKIAVHEIMRHFRYDVQVGKEAWETVEMVKNLFNEVVEYKAIDPLVVGALIEALSDYSDENDGSYEDVLENMSEEYYSATGLSY